MEEKKIQCPNCGGPNSVSDYYKEHVCVFCSSSFIPKEVEEKNSKVRPENDKTYNWMVMAETARDGGNYDEAIQYYNKILEEDSSHSASWFGKGSAIIWSSKLGDIKMSEAITYFKNAIRYSKSNKMKEAIADDLNLVVVAFFPNIQNHYREFKSLDDSAYEYWQRFLILDSGLDYALDCAPNNIEIIENGLKLSSFVGTDLLFKYNVKDIKQKYVQAKQKIDPNWEPKTSACFIATATMGDYDHPTVLHLRNFRDNYLMQRNWGIHFIKIYYKLGPYPARFIAQKEILKKISYNLIIRPLTIITTRLLQSVNPIE